MERFEKKLEIVVEPQKLAKEFKKHFSPKQNMEKYYKLINLKKFVKF